MNIIKRWITRNKIIASISLYLIVGSALYLFFSRLTISAIYNNDAPNFLAKLLSGTDENPPQFYFDKFDSLWMRTNILLVCFLLSISWLKNLIEKKHHLFAALKSELFRIRELLVKYRRLWIFSLLISVFFYSLYLALGIGLIPNYAPDKFTFFFADSYKWVDWNLSEHHKGSHPLMLLYVEIFGFLRFLSPFIPKITLAVILNSFFGSSAIFFAALFFWNYTKSYFETLLITVVFGLTMSQLFFSVLLESYALSASSIVATYALFIACLRSRQPFWGYWILAGLFSFGVTITNFVQTLICFTVIVLLFKEKKRLLTICQYIGSIVTLAFLFSIIQHNLFGGEYFFIPSAANREFVWIRTTIYSDPLLIIQEIIKHFFLVNFIAPSPFPENMIEGNKIILSFFERPLNYSLWGLSGTIVWVCILLGGFYQNLKSIEKNNDKFLLYLLSPIALAILINMSFYSIFNAEEMFIFTCHFTFTVLALVTNKSLLDKRYFQILIGILIFLMGINNLSILREIIVT